MLVTCMLLSCKRKSNISEAITKEAEEMVAKTSTNKSRNVLYLYTDVVEKDSLIGIAYGLPVYEKDKYYLKMVNNTPLLIEQKIYKTYFQNEELLLCNNHKYFRSETYFPNIGEPYYVNIYIYNGKVTNIEHQNVPE